jgi:hypothetical protein
MLAESWSIFEKHCFLERGSERQKSEHRKIRTSKVFVRMIRMSKDQNVKNLERIRTSKVTLVDVMIFFDAIGNIRTSKVCWATTYGVLPMCTKACGGLG